MDPQTPTLPDSPKTVRHESNYALYEVVTPINTNRLENLLKESGYDPVDTKFLIDGFTHGFRLGYEGPRNIKRDSRNLRFRVGDKFDLWDKVMTEVAAHRYAGPYNSPDEIFPDSYSVNPCGLVPKSGNRTRLINHFSYPHGESINDYIPDCYSKVTYQDFQDAISIALQLLQEQTEGNAIDLHFARTDAQNAFRVLPIFWDDRRYQLLKAENPDTGKMQYFADLCCGFGSSSSCFLYSKVSSALRHIYRFKSGIDAVVYLDDGLQIGRNCDETNKNLDIYLGICTQINLPIAKEKTERATKIITFLGLLINAIKHTVEIPSDKVEKALNQVDFITQARKVTVLDMQRITGLLNFFTRAIVPGRAFTRRLYAAYSGRNLLQHHHVRVTGEMKLDLGMWRAFLRQEGNVVRPFVDFSGTLNFVEIPMTSDAAKSDQLGYAACYCDHEQKTVFYCYNQLESGLLEIHDPSIQFLELFALTVGVLLFTKRLKNSRVAIFCDNQAVVHMVNSTTSSCKHCMILIRLLTLFALQNNVDFHVKFVKSEENKMSDFLSRLEFENFKREVPQGYKLSRLFTPKQLLPVAKFFQNIKL